MVHPGMNTIGVPWPACVRKASFTAGFASQTGTVARRASRTVAAAVLALVSFSLEAAGFYPLLGKADSAEVIGASTGRIRDMDLLDDLPQRIAALRANWSVVNPETVREKTTRAEAWLDDVESLLSRPAEEFFVDIQLWDLASFRLFLAIQECISILGYWIAGAALGFPNDAASAFDLLADRTVIDRELATRLREVMRMRDLISHGDFTEDRLHLQGDYLEGVASLRRFLKAVAVEAALLSPA
jgi:uncharacterized protein YutE (UPF0331/DUF86 family)